MRVGVKVVNHGEIISSYPESEIRNRAEAISEAELSSLLSLTSRTFALAIPFLPEPTRRQVGIAYLLLRIADTFEDSVLWIPERQEAALLRFADLLQNPSAAIEGATATWLADPPTRHQGYLELLAATPKVVAGLSALEPRVRATILYYVSRTIQGMASFVGSRQSNGSLELADLADLRNYCFIVAGLVGELLTELFLLEYEQLTGIGPTLRQRSAQFGEALQLVNILKDSTEDAKEGRVFIPVGCDRLMLFGLARDGLEVAREYVLQLQGAQAPTGVVAFNALPVRLAIASLDSLEAESPRIKISRSDVESILAELDRALMLGERAV